MINRIIDIFSQLEWKTLKEDERIKAKRYMRIVSGHANFYQKDKSSSRENSKSPKPTKKGSEGYVYLRHLIENQNKVIRVVSDDETI